MTNNTTGTAPERPSIAVLVGASDGLGTAFDAAEGVADILDNLAELDDGLYHVSRSALQLLADTLKGAVRAGRDAARLLTDGETQP